jgi:phosphohistidine phosphatase
MRPVVIVGWVFGSECVMQTDRQLFLLRHAKSSWADPSLADADRPLAPRGRRALPDLQRQLRAREARAGLVLCSPALRTRQTWDGVRAGLRGQTTERFEPRMYEASRTDLLALIRTIAESETSVLLIGHNPGIGELADGLAGSGEPAAQNRLREGFPTGALAKLLVPGEWGELDWGGAYLESYVRPRDLR